MRTLVYNALKDAWEGGPLQNADESFRIWQVGALGVDQIPAAPAKPFALYSQGVTAPFASVSETSDAENIPFQVYVYDDLGSYIRIDMLIRQIERRIKSLAGEVSPTGARCLGVAWGGVSQDFIDQTYEAAARFASFTVTGSHHKEA